MDIDKLLYQIEAQDIGLPVFQREYVWSKNQAKQLLVSLFNEYPTGSILIWETKKPPKLKGSPLKNKNKNSFVRVLLDGQQRLTTLYLFIKNEIPPYYTEDDLEHDPRDLYFNLETGEFKYYQKQRMQKNPLWQKVTDCFDGTFKEVDIVNKVCEGEEGSHSFQELFEKVNENYNKLKDIKRADYLVQLVPSHASIDEAIDVFDRINSQGTPLTDAELVLAHITGRWPGARRKIKDKREELKENNFNFDLNFFTRCFVVALNNSADYKSMTYEVYQDLQKEDYKEAWNMVERKLDYLLPIIKESAYIDGSSDLVTNNVLIPVLAYLFQHRTFDSEGVKNGFLYWMFLALLWSRLSGQSDQRLDKDVSLATGPNPIKELVGEIEDHRGRIDIKPVDLEGRSARHPLHRMLYTLTKWNNASDWINKGSIRETMGAYNAVQSHHIFPSSLLYDELYDSDNHMERKKVNEVANRAFITRDSNYDISNKRPKKYLKEVDEDILEKHFVPTKEELWDIDRYEDFLRARRKLIADAIEDFLDEYKTKYEGDESQESRETDFKDLMKRGEDAFVEFKSSLRWNYHTNDIDTDLEFVVSKTVAAFANNEGGTLLIGVDDDGSVLGIEKDYKTLGKRQNRDGFSQKLVSVLSNHLGKNISALVSTKIIEIDGSDVCIVNVSESARPVYATQNDKEEFYVRFGATSQPLGMREAEDYIRERWGM